MNNKIKFRVWDKSKKEQPLIFMGGFAVKASGELVGIVGKDVYPVRDKMTIERFTGLKDSGDHEIYENDIIQYVSSDGTKFLGPVKYMVEDDYPAFDVPLKYIPPEFEFDSNVISTGLSVDRIYVIGNVHQNLELLEVDK